jgi:hypothetical protein
VIFVPLSRAAWTGYSTNNYTGFPPSNMLDGNVSTYMAAADATSPFDIWFDLGSAQTFSAISYQRRPDQPDGAGHVQLFVSSDGVSWTGPVFDTTWTDSAGAAIVQTFTPQTVRWVKLHILANAAGDRVYASCAEFYAGSLANVDTFECDAAAEAAFNGARMWAGTFECDAAATAIFFPGAASVVPWLDECGKGNPGGAGGAIGNYAL